MIILNPSDVLRGDASVADKIDYTVHGYNKSVGEPESLADGQLSDSEADILDAAGIVRVIDYITLINTNSSAVTANLYLARAGGTSRRILPQNVEIGVDKGIEIYEARVSIWG